MIEQEKKGKASGNYYSHLLSSFSGDSIVDIFHKKTQKRSHTDYQVTDTWCDRTSNATDRKKRACVSSHAAYSTRLIKE